MLDADVIVVGAGPGGSSAAYHLARRGRRVLFLDRQVFPRDKSCGDGLTPFAVRLLEEMGVLDQLAGAQKVRGGRIFMRGKGHRDFVYPDDGRAPDYGLVVPRLELDEALRRHAVAAGAVFRDGTNVKRLSYDGDTVVGVETTCRGKTRMFRASVVVAADGASSRLARETGRMDPDPQRLGFALRGYYEGLEGLEEMLELYMPLTDVTEQYILPSYAWIFPTGPDTANVGVGVFERVRGVNIRHLFDRFVERQRTLDPRFRNARRCDSWKGAPLRFDFVPERCFGRGFLLVGDAAGLVSPFTGEGISYALESGRLAAEAINRNLEIGRRRTPNLSDYGVLMEQHFAGHFEAGRRSARRYQLAWHVLEDTFHDEAPLFALCRRAVLFPEGVGESHPSRVLDDVSPLISPGRLRVREDLLAVGEMLMESVRRDWPFLGRLSAAGKGDPGIPFRPALLLLLASYFGDPRAPHLIRVGAAVELGYLAGVAHASVGEEGTDSGHLRDGEEDALPDRMSGPNWGNMLAVMAGDFLLTKAYELSAEAGTGVSAQIIEALERVCEGRVAELECAYDPELTEADHRSIVRRKTASLFALPCRLGALLSGAPPDAARALEVYGRRLGTAFQLADDALEMRGQATSLGRANAADLPRGIYGLPVLRALRLERDSHGGDGSLRDLLDGLHRGEVSLEAVRRYVRRIGAVDETMEEARKEAARAREVLDNMADGPATRSLGRIATYAVDRSIPEKYSLSEVLIRDL